MELEFSRQMSAKMPKYQNAMKFRLLESELFDADWQMDAHTGWN